MGASGSGKTSLLNVLSGKTPWGKGLKLTGRVSINGVSQRRSRHRQAYVRQEDVFYSQLTVAISVTLVLSARGSVPTASLPFPTRPFPTGAGDVDDGGKASPA